MQIRQPLALRRCGLTGTTAAFTVATLGAHCVQRDGEDTTLFSNTSPLQLYPVPYPSVFSDAALDYIWTLIV